jgi:hypothetical protein
MIEEINAQECCHQKNRRASVSTCLKDSSHILDLRNISAKSASSSKIEREAGLS